MKRCISAAIAIVLCLVCCAIIVSCDTYKTPLERIRSTNFFLIEKKIGDHVESVDSLGTGPDIIKAIKVLPLQACGEKGRGDQEYIYKITVPGGDYAPDNVDSVLITVYSDCLYIGDSCFTASKNNKFDSVIRYFDGFFSFALYNRGM